MWYDRGNNVNAFCTGIFLMSVLHWLEYWGERKYND